MLAGGFAIGFMFFGMGSCMYLDSKGSAAKTTAAADAAVRIGTNAATLKVMERIRDQ